MDPFTAYQIAIAGIGVCIQTAKLVKKTIENTKQVKHDLLKLVDETERYRNVLGLLKVMTRELLRTTYKDMELAINKEQMLGTLDILHRVASSIAETDQKSGQVLAGIQWTFKKSEAEKLTVRLREEQSQLMAVVGLINATAALRSLQELERMKAETLDKVTVAKAFENLTLNESDERMIRHTWLGHVNSEIFPPDYIAARNELSDAAYYGEWRKVFELLEHGRQRYQENWVNAIRISAVSLYASHVKLLDYSASSSNVGSTDRSYPKTAGSGGIPLEGTLRTHYSEFSYVDQTPSEIANDQGYANLARILAPIVRSPVPNLVLDKLESNFHNLIRHDLGDRVDQEHWYLPVLAVLTELYTGAIWFEVKKHEFKNAGYWFRLDGRDLLVRSQGIRAAHAVKEYRITSHRIEEVQDATLINEND